MAIGKREKRKPSYVTLHNNAVVRFQKSSRIFIWAGVVNFVGLIIGNIQYATGNLADPPFYFCFGIANFGLNLIYFKTELPIVWLYVIAYAIALLLTAGAVLLGVFSSQAKKKFLYASVIVYFVDWIFVLLAFFLAGESWMGLLFNGGIHAIITFFLVIAIYEYHNVLNIEKRFEKPKQENNEEGEEKEDDTHGND